MLKLLHPLFLVLAHAKHRDLIHQIQYLKIENDILRLGCPKKIIATPAKRRRLIKYGKPVGAAIKELISIVHPRTFARWLAEARKVKPARRRRGRPPTAAHVRDLILRLARENDWGYTRILGELKKLGIFRVGRTTVQNWLTANGLDPGPKRGRGTWDQFIRRHAQTLWACDSMSIRTWTWRGPRDCFILFFIHVESRRVWVSPATTRPTAEWVAQQARNFCMHLTETGQSITHLLRDRDGKFTESFDTIIKSSGADVCRLPFRSPNLNAYAERWCQSLQVECLDHFVVFGERHMDHLVSEFVDHYHQHRPHQSKNNEPLQPFKIRTQDKIICEERLGGLIKHYFRRAA